MSKVRLDQLLSQRNLVSSREKAQALILAGKVSVNGQRADKPGQLIDETSELLVAEPPRYVSRGGFKLEAALTRFGVDVNNRVCMDVGTSTGGFTDCLLQHGALRVHCVDTGAGQIDWKLRTDPRVVLHENTNARYLSPELVGELLDCIVCDVSFISVTLIVPALVPLLRPDGDFLVLVKPQFEAGREHVGRGGIVRDPEAHRLACRRVAERFVAAGFNTALAESPLLGAEGNREFLLHARHTLL